MAMSGAERQRRYRERHHDIAHLTIDVHVDVRDRLDRLAWHYDCCLTELVEKLAAAAEKHVEAKLQVRRFKRIAQRGYRKRNQRCVREFS